MHVIRCAYIGSDSKQDLTSKLFNKQSLTLGNWAGFAFVPTRSSSNRTNFEVCLIPEIIFTINTFL